MDMEIVRKAADEAGVEWYESFEGEGCVNMEILQRFAVAIVAKEPKGPSYCGIPLGLMLYRLRETHGQATLKSSEAGWTVVTPECEAAGNTAFHAAMSAYKEIHHLYAEGDQKLRVFFSSIRQGG